MVVVKEKVYGDVTFGELEIGDVFRYGTMYYMKTSQVIVNESYQNAIRLTDTLVSMPHEFDYFMDYKTVEKVHAKLVIE